MVPVDFDFSLLPGLTDSKKLSPKKRERLFTSIESLERENLCRFAYAESNATLIDQVGIREANRLAMYSAIQQILPSIDIASVHEILIDGRDNYFFSEQIQDKVRFIVRGDLSEPVISAASIVAKVLRDRKLCDFSVEYPGYFFELHKGYGTRLHEASLLNYGISPIHRKTYAPVKRLISRDS
jgi:ribonuclease HII